MYLTCLGVTEKDDFYSKLVRESKMSRGEALQRIEKENELHVDVIEDIFRQLGIADIDVSRWYDKSVH